MHRRCSRNHEKVPCRPRTAHLSSQHIFDAVQRVSWTSRCSLRACPRTSFRGDIQHTQGQHRQIAAGVLWHLQSVLALALLPLCSRKRPEHFHWTRKLRFVYTHTQSKVESV